MTLKIQKLTPAIGAVLDGISLSGSLYKTQLDEIYDALIDNQVIFFREQNISPENHLALALSFGQPQLPNPLYPRHEYSEHIMILRSGADCPPDTGGWHTDVTYNQAPPFASLLVARQVPDCGGDTLWLSLSKAWETLPAGVQTEVAELSAVHDLGDFRNNFSIGEQDGSKLTEAHQNFGSAIHPVVQTHPVSGRKFLYINESFTQQIIGMRSSESNRMLNFLYRHIEQPEHQVRFQWSCGDIAIWDNRCTSHYATNDYLPHSREMHRITIVNDARKI